MPLSSRVMVGGLTPFVSSHFIREFRAVTGESPQKFSDM